MPFTEAGIDWSEMVLDATAEYMDEEEEAESV